MSLLAEKPASSSKTSAIYVALTGNPNCGKTTIFNALTGLKAKVGNYAGVTVERKEGRLKGAATSINILDLPGTYSLSPKSLDEQISRDALFHRLPELPSPRVVVIVIDASNLERNLYYATQVIELGYPTITALNMLDVAEQNGHMVDVKKLSEVLGTTVVPLVANTGQGLEELKAAIETTVQASAPLSPPKKFYRQELIQKSLEILTPLIQVEPGSPLSREAQALLFLTDEKVFSSSKAHYSTVLEHGVLAERARLETAGIDWRTSLIEARYAEAGRIHQEVITEVMVDKETLSDKLDRVLTHRIWGLLIFVSIMALMFQSIFSFAEYPMTWIETGVNWIGTQAGNLLPPGDLNSLLVDGIIAGVGSVIVFLPQICLLFIFIGLLEDTGYMARAAFLMDRLMSKVGLHGKSFIPMLSSFACAIPGIMATRTIETPKDRLVTILVAPLMSCSARLPVYTVLIAACIPKKKALGFFTMEGLTLFCMYFLGIVVALLMAWLFKKTILRGETPMLIMELPPYKKPVVSVVLHHMWERSKIFLRRAGTVILGISIILWFLVTYPRNEALTQRYEQQRSALQASQEEALKKIDAEERGALLRQSFAGRMGQWIEPLIAPLGFDWKIGIGVVGSFAAREVFVSTMSTVYSVADADDEDEGNLKLADVLRTQTRPDGTQLFTPLVGVTLMVFYVFALQCVSTVAIVRRETNSWKWPVFQWIYMGVLAWVFAFITYQGGRLLGF